MKLVHPDYLFSIDFKEDETYTVVVENPEEFYNLTNELIGQSNGEEGKFVLSNKKILNMKKDLDVLTDIYSVDINSTKSKNKLYKYLDKTKNDYHLEVKNLDAQIYKLISEIENDLVIDIEYSFEVDYKNILKAIDLKFYNDFDSFIEKLINYINVYTDFFNIETYVLINLKSFLTQSTYEELLNYKTNKEINILFIESRELTFNSKYDKIYIIDRDLSEIY